MPYMKYYDILHGNVRTAYTHKVLDLFVHTICFALAATMAKNESTD